MTDKTARELTAPSDSASADGQGRRTPRALVPSVTAQELSLSQGWDQKIMGSTSEDVERSSPKEPPTSKQKPSLYATVTGLIPINRGSSQKPRPVITDQHAKSPSKLQEENIVLQKSCEKARGEHSDAIIEIQRLRSLIELAEKQHQAAEIDARQKIDHLENEIKETREGKNRAARHLKAARDQITHLDSKLNTVNEDFLRAEKSAQEEIAYRTAEVEATNQELFAEKSTAQKEITQLQSRIKLLNEKNDKFRQMLIPVSEKQVLDSDVVQKFRSLRSGMLGLVRRTWTLKIRDDFDDGSLSRDQLSVFKSGPTSDYDRLRYALFHIIHQRIIGPRNYFLQIDFERCEEGLRLAEEELFEKTTMENRKLAMEWRNASFKATENFRGNGRHLSRDTQRHIWDFFAPLQRLDTKAGGAGRNNLEAICDSAVDLGLMIRQLKDNFWVDDLSRAVDTPLSEWGEFADEMASVVAGDGKRPGSIAYVIAGALIKNPKENLEKVLVLEKAEVAVYR